jgi:predicted dehydrogenase
MKITNFIKAPQVTGRRTFLKNVSGLAVAGMTALSYNRVLGANERVRLALIGCGGRGEWVARGFVEDGHEFVHLVDPCDSHAQHVGKILQEQQGLKPALSKTALAAMEDSSVNAVVIATPDHWHALLFLQACRAEKDIYLEKPQSHNIHEGRLMVQAAKKYNRIVQIGAQNRSAPYNFAARDAISSGSLGDIRLVKVYNMKSSASFHERNQPYSLADPQLKPDDLDWNLWLGPAPFREIGRASCRERV